MTLPGLTVNKPGPLSLIEDLGRSGFFRQGLTSGGAADRLSFLWANRLCGNRANTAALEILLGGVELTATDYCQIAVAGGETDIRVNALPARNWSSHNLAPGDKLAISPLIRGLRIYLAVRGGFQVPAVFGSTSTVPREKIGGLNGGPLKTGDFLAVVPARSEPDFYLPPASRPRLHGQQGIRMVPGWQYRAMAPRLKKAFFSGRFKISPHSDRMGIRLQCAPLAGDETLPRQMISEGVLAGAVQIPPDGQPIIMMNDHQTMGGYPKIGNVITPDLWRLAQMRPGMEIAFLPVSGVRARRLSREIQREFESTQPHHA